jgi:hypothetical protein
MVLPAQFVGGRSQFGGGLAGGQYALHAQLLQARVEAEQGGLETGELGRGPRSQLSISSPMFLSAP